MRSLLLSLVFLTFSVIAAVPAHAAIVIQPTAEKTAVEEAPAMTKRQLRQQKRQERRAERKAKRAKRKAAWQAIKGWWKNRASDDLLLIIIITILLPPLGMYLFEGDFTDRVLISLLLWLLFYLPGLIYTLIVILD